MEFGWDPAKSNKVFRERGFDLAYASRIFQGPRLEAIDHRKNYGEVRIKAIGLIDGRAYSVVYTIRNDVQ